ncbi:MAG: hypothetical protein LBU68_02350 [Rickettsiales bacterium]|jgi:uncharacterized HAD superfamily protein|nr:hypothetical protein [Rickettsiales bacterium]
MVKKLNIAFDIDGVLTDAQRFAFDYGYELFRTPVVNPNAYYENEIFGLSSERYDDFWNRYGLFYFGQYPMRDFAAQVIKQLHEDGHNVVFITSRNNLATGYCKMSWSEFQKLVNNWFEKSGIPNPKIIYCDGSKLPYCLEQKIDVMVEDKAEHVLELSKSIKMICFDVDYNRHVKGKNILRAYSMLEVYDLVKSISDVN